MKQLIVNADDFGMTKGVSRGILEAHRDGIVTSASLLANGAAFETALDLRSQAPRLGVGVHLNLSEGAPVSRVSELCGLLDRRGQLHLAPPRLWRAIRNRAVRLSEIEIELRAQIRKIVDAGIAPTHFDGHMHVHVLPGVAEIVIGLAQEFGVSAIRCPVEPAGSIVFPLRRLDDLRGARITRRIIAFGVSFFARRFRKLIEKAGLLAPAHFYGNSKTGFLDIECLRDILMTLPEGVSELMCHPGYVDSDLPPSHGYPLPERDAELMALTSHGVRQLAAAQEIELISFGNLAVSKRSGVVA